MANNAQLCYGSWSEVVSQSSLVRRAVDLKSRLKASLAGWEQILTIYGPPKLCFIPYLNCFCNTERSWRHCIFKLSECLCFCVCPCPTEVCECDHFRRQQILTKDSENCAYCLHGLVVELWTPNQEISRGLGFNTQCGHPGARKEQALDVTGWVCEGTTHKARQVGRGKGCHRAEQSPGNWPHRLHAVGLMGLYKIFLI